MSFRVNGRLPYWLVLTFGVLYTTSGIAEIHEYEPPKAAIHPATLKSIRDVGQAVLAAKNTPRTTPTDVQTLQQKIESLRAVVERVEHPLGSSALGLVELKPSSPPATPNPVATRRSPPDPEAVADRELVNAKNDLHKQRLAIKRDSSKRGQDHIDRHLRKAVTAKAEALEKEIDDLRRESGGMRAEHLASLRERLKGRKSFSMPEKVTPTPTLTTIVNHLR